MRTQGKWSPNSIYKGSWGFVRDTENRRLSETESFVIIRRYIETGARLTDVALGAKGLCVWYYWECVAVLSKGAEEGLRLAHLAACAQLVDSDVVVRNIELMPRARRRAMQLIEKTSFALATFMMLGTINDAETVFRFQLNCIQNGQFLNCDTYIYPRYLLELFAAWKGEKIDLDPYGFRSMEAYGDLLNVWDTADQESLSKALAAACDLHIARSRNTTHKEYFDFDTEYTRVLPFEIMALLRLRELRGLPNPVVDHPLLNIPTAKLYPLRDIPWNPVLLAGYEKARAELDERKKSMVPD